MSQGGARPKTTTTTTTTTEEETKKDDKDVKKEADVKIKLQKRDSKKSVNWTEETVDNENLGRKKSKCCCIYVKPKAFDESDTDDEDKDGDECDHCPGHHGKDLKKQ